MIMCIYALWPKCQTGDLCVMCKNFTILRPYYNVIRAYM